MGTEIQLQCNLGVEVGGLGESVVWDGHHEGVLTCSDVCFGMADMFGAPWMIRR